MEAALVLSGIRKSFPGVTAVDGVDLDVCPGEIHALVGENGAGKSTLANIAFGTIRADEGTVSATGTVGLVHQHFQLVGRLRVWENVLLGREPRRFLRIDAAAARQRVRALAQESGLEVDVDAYVDDLPIGVQQRVELLRELVRDPAVLLLDEPTAALAPAEIERFFSVLKALAARGTALLVITHKLQEVIAHSTRVSVMRRGVITGRFDARSTTVDEIARAMIGGDIPAMTPRVDVRPEPCFHVRNLRAGSGAGALNGVSFDVGNAEIVGIAGVEGNGQTTLADAIAGLIPFDGTIEIFDTDAQVSVIPQDRRSEGLILKWSIAQNMLLGRQRDAGARGFLLDRERADGDARIVMDRFDVRAPSAHSAVETLSGGNQQKIVVGRALIDGPSFLLAYQPTRGVDVGATALLQSRLIEARNAGTAILLISFDLDELLQMADRLLVMYRGAIAGSFDRDAFDRALIGRLMAGAAA